jgi:hypothetical protein
LLTVSCNNHKKLFNPFCAKNGIFQKDVQITFHTLLKSFFAFSQNDIKLQIIFDIAILAEAFILINDPKTNWAIFQKIIDVLFSKFLNDEIIDNNQSWTFINQIGNFSVKKLVTLINNGKNASPK